ncbi:MAG: heme biosynthesis protein HemY [Betaproteobacteria bacterium]|nr:heme biosynthesis protein HemY [Betaproteobacteria bacterium]
MRGLFWLVAVFAAAVSLAVVGRVSEGVVVLVIPPWKVEASLVLFAAALLAVFAVLYLAVQLVSHTLALPAQVRAYRERRRRDEAQLALAVALQAYYEGRYARAEKEAMLAWESGAVPGLAALIAARAAHQLRQRERRDLWLERAGKAGEPMQAAMLLTKAELALDERDFRGARDALRSLHGAGPRNIAAARMLLRAERGGQNWQEVLRLASMLGKRAAIAPAIAEEYRVQAHIEMLAGAAGDRAPLEACWRKVPGPDRVHLRVAAAAAGHATALGEAALAREILEGSLNSDWSEALVTQYAELPFLEPQSLEREARARLERAERWLPAHAQDARLLLTLGRLCKQSGLWGKARDYLEASLSFENSRAAHLALARLADRDGRAADAQRHHRLGAELP